MRPWVQSGESLSQSSRKGHNMKLNTTVLWQVSLAIEISYLLTINGITSPPANVAILR